jgi:hypothetical protein
LVSVRSSPKVAAAEEGLAFPGVEHFQQAFAAVHASGRTGR